MVAASLLVVSMLGGIVATSWQAQRAEQQAQLAEQQAARAEKQQLKAEKIGEFFRNVLMSSSSQWMSKIRKGPDVTMAEVLEISAERADKELADQPEIHADVLDTIAQSLQGMGLYEKARDVALKATKIADTQLPADDQLRANTHYHYAQNLHLKGEFDAAAKEYELAIERGTRILAPDAENMALMHNDYSVLLTLQSKLEEAMREQRLAIDLQRRRTKGGLNPPIAIGTANIGGIKTMTGDLIGALKAFNDAIEMFAQLPERKYAEKSQALNNRSRVYQLLGETTKARDDAVEATQIAGETFGMDHPIYALVLLRRAETEIALGNFDAAEQNLNEGHAIVSRHIDVTHPYNARFQIGFGYLYLERGEPEKSRSVLNKAITSLEAKALTATRPDYSFAHALGLQGEAELALHHPQRARELLDRSLRMYRELFGPDVYVTRKTQALFDKANAAAVGDSTKNQD